MTELFTVRAKDTAGNPVTLIPEITKEDGEYRILLKKEQLDRFPIASLWVDSPLTENPAGAPGYMFFPTFFYGGVAMCRFDEKPDTSLRTLTSAMPVCGIGGTERAVFVQVKKMDSDARFFVRVKDGVYRISPEIVLDGDAADEDVLITYRPMPGATYMDMAKVYRRFQMEQRGCRPLRERAAEREQLRRAADCIELRVRMGWKPQPTPVRCQTLENEPPMKIACDIPTLHKIIDRMKDAGVSGAEICLVGWGPGGHDGRFPQQVPSDERFGGDDALREFIKKAQSYGYMVVCHTNSKGAYEIAENWDPSALTVRRDENGEKKIWLRSDYAKDGLQGGDPWHVCAKPAYEQYAVHDLPLVRDYGFCGLHYVDELTACEPVKCCADNHPVTRRQTIEYYRKIAQLSTKLFGGFQSEAWLDFLNADTDYVLYTSVASQLSHERCALYDELLPFWVLTYHGIVMSGATSGTVNYPIKEEFEHLRMVEFGSRPMLYINSKFEGRDWMGKTDLYCSDDAEIERTVAAIKTAADEYDTLKHLQYEFIENHEKIGDTVRVTYSDGTVITVDYASETYRVEKGERHADQ
ncbi:MAG: hypothetical protein IJD06_09930 [Clostridia bacterium]|nr:hypothetical protein [Clostridia bacterium]